MSATIMIITARKRSCGKVMFSFCLSKRGRDLWSHVLSTGISGTRSLLGGMSGGGVCMSRGGYLAPLPDTFDLGYYGIRSTIRRYASYWNVFLLTLYVCVKHFVSANATPTYPSPTYPYLPPPPTEMVQSGLYAPYRNTFLFSFIYLCTWIVSIILHRKAKRRFENIMIID